MVKPRSFTQFRNEEAGALKKEFEKSNPEYWAQIQGRSQDIERAKEVIKHTNDAQRILIENFREERTERIAQMAVEVWKERAQHHDYVAPHVAAYLMAENSVLQEAAKRVDEDHRQDLAALKKNEAEAIGRIAEGKHPQDQSFSKKEIEAMTDQEKQTHFKAEVHKLIDASNEARFQVSKMMNNERERLLEEAKENGSENPQDDLKALQSSMYKAVKDKLHGDFHALCLKYGYSADQQHVAFYAQYPERIVGAQENASDQHQRSASKAKSEDIQDQQVSSKSQDDDQEQ